MSKELEALRAMWPMSIPAADYERALRLVAALRTPSTPAAPAVVPTPKRWKGKRGGTTVGVDTLARVRDLLVTGPATARELAAATGFSEHNVYVALRQLGAVKVGKAKRADGRVGLPPSVYALEAA